LARQPLARQRCSLEPKGKDATVIRERIGSPEGRRTLMSFMADVGIDAPQTLGPREALLARISVFASWTWVVYTQPARLRARFLQCTPPPRHLIAGGVPSGSSQPAP
jgi:hypothetical protein